jgi:hypothetical protein
MPEANFPKKIFESRRTIYQKMPIDIVTWIYSRMNRVADENFDNQLAETVKNLKTISGYSLTIDLSNRVKKVA